jgi:hypothetical protein
VCVCVRVCVCESVVVHVCAGLSCFAKNLSGVCRFLSAACCLLFAACCLLCLLRCFGPRCAMVCFGVLGRSLCVFLCHIASNVISLLFWVSYVLLCAPEDIPIRENYTCYSGFFSFLLFLFLFPLFTPILLPPSLILHPYWVLEQHMCYG